MATPTMVASSEEELVNMTTNLGQLMFDFMNMNAALIYDKQAQTPKAVPVTVLPTGVYEPVAERMWQSTQLMQKLYASVATDHDFLLQHLKPMAAHDDYLAMLIETLEMNRNRHNSPICLVGRSDFMILEETVSAPNLSSQHSALSDPRPIATTKQKFCSNPIIIGNVQYTPQQVEFNTMSSGLIGVSHRTQLMHEYLIHTPEISMNPLLNSEEYQRDGKFLPHIGQEGTARTLAFAVNYFQNLLSSLSINIPAKPVVLMVTQENEFNVPDQRLIEYNLQKNHGIGLIRASLDQVEQFLSFKPVNSLLTDSPDGGDSGCAKKEMIPFWMGKLPVAVIYYRSCYTPLDFFMSNDHNTAPNLPDSNPNIKLRQQRRIQLYREIESSLAVKCPNVGLFLSGMKKIQQLLTQRHILARYLTCPDEIAFLQALFAEIHSLQDEDDDSVAMGGQKGQIKTDSKNSQDEQALIREQRQAAIASAIESPHLWVLKPMREGGGNNLYGEELKMALMNNQVSDCILMKKIVAKSKSPYVMNAVVPCHSTLQNEIKKMRQEREQFNLKLNTDESLPINDRLKVPYLSLIHEFGFSGGLFAEVITRPAENNKLCEPGTCFSSATVDKSFQLGDCKRDSCEFVHPLEISTKDDVCVKDQSHDGITTSLCITYNETFGVLIRSKEAKSNEGGLAIGKAVLSSLIVMPIPGIGNLWAPF